MDKQSTITMDIFNGILVGDTIIITEPLVLKWWVKLWKFITFKKVEPFIDREYIVTENLSGTTITICADLTPATMTEASITKPDEPNFVRFQNDFKRRGN